MPIYFKNTVAKEPFTFDSVGNNWDQEAVIRSSGYPGYHYLQTESGSGQIVIQGKTYTLNEGEGVLIAPFISHSYKKTSENWTTCFITFAGSMENNIDSILENRKIIFIKEEQGARITEIISDIIIKYKNSPAATKALSVECYRLLMEFVEGIYSDDFAENPLYMKYVAPVIKEIQTTYASRLTVQELSNKVYVTPQYLSRLFRRFIGCSVYEYLTNYRISKAKELLQTKTRMEIQTIAEQVGFEEPSHFIAMFKKQTGITPFQFRKTSFL